MSNKDHGFYRTPKGFEVGLLEEGSYLHAYYGGSVVGSADDGLGHDSYCLGERIESVLKQADETIDGILSAAAIERKCIYRRPVPAGKTMRSFPIRRREWRRDVENLNISEESKKLLWNSIESYLFKGAVLPAKLNSEVFDRLTDEVTDIKLEYENLSLFEEIGKQNFLVLLRR